MKNAMKRIMGLLLVAVLLVSVVPFQALAAAIEGGTDYKGFQYIEAHFGDEVKTAAWQKGPNDPQTKTIKDILDHFWSGWSANYRFRDASYAGQTGITDINTTLHTNFDNTSVVIYLYGIPQFKATVTYKLDGTGEIEGYAEFTRKDGESLSFNDIANAAPKQDAYKVDRVVVNDSEYKSGSFTVNRELYPVAYLVAKGGNGGSGNGGNSGTDTSKLTAQYYVNGTLRTENYDVDGKTVSELVSDSKLGGYNANNYNITAKVGNTTKGMNDVVYRGETVAITMTTKTAPSTSKLNAQYYVDGVLRTEAFDVDGKTVSELVSDSKLGGYNANNYNISAKVGNTSKGMNDVIYRGETVAITMNTKSTPSTDVLTAKYYINNSLDDTINYTQYEHKTVRELISLGGYDIDDYSNVTAKVGNSSKGLNDVIERGETVKIYLTKKTTSNKFPYDVVLNVYLNNSVGEPDKRININDLAADGVISMSEVQNLLTDKYYKAKNSKGITYDGLYLARGNWVEAFSRDYDKYEKITGVDEMRKESRIDINVMLTNATRKTSSTADSSNPKTGDAIFMTITVMGLSAAALTGLYFYDKKRKAL